MAILAGSRKAGRFSFCSVALTRIYRRHTNLELGRGDCRKQKDTTMKDPKPAPDLIAPTINPKETRRRMRNLENLLTTMSNNLQTAREEYHFLIYGEELKSRENSR